MKHPVFKTLWLFLLLISASSYGQNAELLYTSATLTQALDYKDDLNADKLSTSNALSLYNISEARMSSYLEKIASKDAVLVLGEVAFKATSSISFTMPLITIDAVGEASATGPVIFVFESGSDIEEDFIKDLRMVSDVKSFSLTAKDLQDGSRTAIKYKGVKGIDIVNKLLSEIARIK